ncbi:iron ABC transporter permease [Anaplasma platys]|uniref:Iron ABC transporter permease n=1 Tax=Anaplasma platys TaxID=949 RepID=A0A858PYW1_9RICK|nr:iron ABC transporter permease [Anaplasma platys]QJC27806.1 iron ABC transporter permease [Anaplasma platys]
MGLQRFSRYLFFIVLAALFALPIFSLIMVFFTDSKGGYGLLSTLLPEYTLNTIVLMIGAGIVVLFIGVISAWFITYYSFPGRRIFEVALFLPLSIPGYIVAYVYVNMFEYAGPVQTALRDFFGWGKGDYYFPNVKSLFFCTLIVGFNLYPYVYMLARTAFMAVRNSVAVATTLGCSRYKILSSVVIPAVWPSVVAGVSLVLMEVVSDFGTPQFLAINTFTTGIYRHWFLLHDKYSACILAVIGISFVFMLTVLEKCMRREDASYYSIKMNTNYCHRWHFNSKWVIALIYSICSLAVLMGFILPVAPLIYWTWERVFTLDFSEFFIVVLNSLSISLAASAIVVTISIIMVCLTRGKGGLTYAVRFISMGYAIPSTITAVGIVILLGKVSQFVSDHFFNLALIGTGLGLLYSYTFRFLAAAIGPVEAGLNKIPIEVDWASRLMGHGAVHTCVNVHMPMLKKSILVGFLLVFIDSIKELAATLIIRPFNFETMAIRMYELVGDERQMDAAPYAMGIVLIGFMAVIILFQIFQHDKVKENRINEY